MASSSALRSAGWSLAAAAVAVGAAALFLAEAAERWREYRTSAFDLAFFDQLIWNLSRGNGWDSTFIDYSFLGQHVEPILLVFVPAYWLGAGPLVLTCTQAVVAAGAAIPLFFAARRAGLTGAAAFAAALAYLANSYLHRGIAFDFHPEVMAVLPAFAAAWAVFAGRPRLGALLALSALLLKEDAVSVPLFVAALLWVRGHNRPAAWTAAVAVGYTALAVGLVMPWARDGADSDLVARFGAIAGGETDGEVVRALITEPWRVPLYFASEGRWRAVALFVALSGPLAVRKPWLLAAASPILVAASLSGHEPQHRLELHYAATAIPLLLIAAVAGAIELKPRWRRFVPLVLAGPSLAGAAMFSPLAPWQSEPGPTAGHRQAIAAALALIPGDAPVAAQSNLLAHLSQRPEAYEFPDSVSRAEWFIFDDGGHVSSQSIAGGFDRERDRLDGVTERVWSNGFVEVRRRIAPDPP